MSLPPLRVLFVSITDSAEALEAAVQESGLTTEIARVDTPEDALVAIREGGVDLCFAPSTAGPDASASLTLALARDGAYVPVIAVVDRTSAGFEAIADEGAADFVCADDLNPQSVGRALLVAHARAEAVARFQAVQSDRDAVLAATGSVAATLDAKGRVVDLRAAPPLQSDFGEATPGTRFASLFSSDSRAGAVDALRQASDGRSGRFIQTRARAGRPLLLRWTIVGDASGYRAVGVDRSEANREATRADLFRGMLQAIVEQTAVSAFLVDASGSFLFVLDPQADESRGQSVFDLYSDSPRAVAAIRRAIAGETVRDHATLYDGRRVRLHAEPMSLGSQEPLGALCVMTGHDDSRPSTSERSRLDAALPSEAILIVDPVGTPVYLSPAMRALAGKGAAELASEGGVTRLFTDPSVRTEIARSVRSGDAWSGAVRLLTSGGDAIDCEVTAQPIFDPEGERVGSVARFQPADAPSA